MTTIGIRYRLVCYLALGAKAFNLAADMRDLTARRHRPSAHTIRPVSQIYVTGHRNPDTDSIASAIGYAELKQRLDSENEYVPVRLGEMNAQTQWVLKRSGCRPPDFLPHVMLRVRDVMREGFAVASHDEPVREVGLEMARKDLDLVPVVDAGGALAGVVTERALAHRYIRESRQASSLDAPTALGNVVDALEGELVAGGDREVAGRVWTYAMDPATHRSQIAEATWSSPATDRTLSAWQSSSAPPCSWRATGSRRPTRSLLWPTNVGRRSSSRPSTPTCRAA
jgi:hypothetical protein